MLGLCRQDLLMGSSSTFEKLLEVKEIILQRDIDVFTDPLHLGWSLIFTRLHFL